MPDDWGNFVRGMADEYAYQFLMRLIREVIPQDSIIIPLVTYARKHGMPVKELVPFVDDVAKWCALHDDKVSDDELDALNELFQNSGIHTDYPKKGGDDHGKQ